MRVLPKEEFLRLVEQGCTNKEIQKHFKCSNNTVSYNRKLYGVSSDVTTPLSKKLGLTDEEFKSQLQTLYWEQGLDTEQVAEHFNTSRSVIRKYMKQYGIERRKSGAPDERNGRWNDGKSIQRGYVKVKMPDHPYADKNGYVYEHRLVAEQLYGGPIPLELHVHHKNGIKHDNRLENLEILPASEHHKLHGPEYGRKRAEQLKQISKENDRKVWELWETTNLTPPQIAEKLGLHPNTVYRKLKEMGLR